MSEGGTGVVHGQPRVGILMGSDSDLPLMEEAGRVLAEFGVPYELTVASAHRSPDRVHAYAREAEGRGIQVLIAGAGGAALGGLDSLLSTVQMPSGVPVATVGIGAARNAGLLAVQILATSDPALRDRFRQFKARLAAEVEAKAARVAAGMAPGAGRETS